MSEQEIQNLSDVRLAMRRHDDAQRQQKLMLIGIAMAVFMAALLTGYAAGRLVEYFYANV